MDKKLLKTFLSSLLKFYFSFKKYNFNRLKKFFCAIALISAVFLNTHVNAMNFTAFNEESIVDPVSVSITADKTLIDESDTGRELKDDEFEFQIRDSDGKVVSTGYNNEEGLITFETFEIDNTGEFSYTVREVDTGNDNIIYSDDYFTFTVSVQQTGNTLYAEIIVEDKIVDSYKRETEEDTEDENMDTTYIKSIDNESSPEEDDYDDEEYDEEEDIEEEVKEEKNITETYDFSSDEVDSQNDSDQVDYKNNQLDRDYQNSKEVPSTQSGLGSRVVAETTIYDTTLQICVWNFRNSI